MESIPAVPAEAKQKLEFAHDYMGRRIQKKVWVWRTSLGSYLLQSVTKFIYDGWNLVAELDAANRLIRSYVWGQDISGRLAGAGGIGGLLLIREGASTFQVGYDGNGSVAALVNSATGTVAASYDYDPFGNILKATGSVSSRNPFGFSTKYTDVETDLIYYGFRYYHAGTGRWISRDPIEEAGGLNLYAFLSNDPVNQRDLLGLRNVNVKVVVKSFIQQLGPNPGEPPPGTLPQNWDFWVQLWKLMYDNFRENPATDAKDKNYRLYSERTFKVCVVNGRIEEVKATPEGTANTDVGPEPPVTPPPMIIWGIKESNRGSSFGFEWSGKGKPHDLAEPLFQRIRSRKSKYIWHTISGEITAAGDDVRVTVNLKGSIFPSRRAWVNSERMASDDQGPLRALWESHPEDPERVR